MSATSPKLPKFADTVDEAEKGPFPRTKSQASLVNRQDNELPNPPGAFPIRETNGKNGSDVQESRAKGKE
ncbi:hypothetical protein CPB86DRAFT_132611 [Serendipita vermifera]|nr:hypothetical protein CPB86DRAFT_132611 [Serendipita vermifera]